MPVAGSIAKNVFTRQFAPFRSETLHCAGIKGSAWFTGQADTLLLSGNP
jgi:hypothetical protein